jgi:hypothetical protein
MCNTVNDSSAQSCKYCGYIFEDVSPASTPSSVSSAGEISPQNVITPPEGAIPSTIYKSPSFQSSAPVFVVSSSWRDRRNLTSIIIGAVLAIFYIVSDLPAISGSGFSVTSLIFLIFPALFIVPAFLSSRTYEFYDNVLVIKGVGSNREIPYSQISAVSNYRGAIVLQLSNQWRQIRVQGKIKSNTSGVDLPAWLNQKVKPQQPPDPDKSSAQDTGD